MRTINAPGTELNEIDVSQYNGTLGSLIDTTTLAFGFADKGDDYTPKYIQSLVDFTSTYGYPTNEAERYFYNTAKEIFKKGAVMIGAKLPYDNKSLGKFTYTKYKLDNQIEKIKSPFDIVDADHDNKNLRETFELFDFEDDVKDNLSSMADTAQKFHDFVFETCNFHTVEIPAESLLSSNFIFDNLSAILAGKYDEIKTISSDFVSWQELRDTISKMMPTSKDFDTESEFISSYVDFSTQFKDLFSKKYKKNDRVSKTDLKNALVNYIPTDDLKSETSFKVFESYYNFAKAFAEVSQHSNFTGTDYLTKFELQRALEKVIPTDPSKLDTMDSTIDSFVKFSNAFKELWSDSPRGAELTTEEIEVETLDKIRTALINSGYKTYLEFMMNFYNSSKISGIKDMYNAISGTPELSSELLDYSVVSADFNGILISIKGSLNYIDSCKIIKNTDETGMMTLNDIDSYLVGQAKVESNTFCLVDKTRCRYSKDRVLKTNQDDPKETNEYIGVVPVVVSPINAIYYQRLIDNEENINQFNVVSSLSTVASPENTLVPSVGTNFGMPLSADRIDKSCLGSVASEYFPPIKFKNADELDTRYLKQIGIVVFKMTIDASNENRVMFTPVESFVGSLDRKMKDPITNASTFLEDIINTQSDYLYFFSNIDETNDFDTYYINNQRITSLGFYSTDCTKDISVEKSIKKPLEIIFERLKDVNYLNIDLVVDGGVSNIAQYIASTQGDGKGKYTPESDTTNSYYMINTNTVLTWRNIIEMYRNFCEFTRKDCMFIADGPRNLGLTGNYKIVRRTQPLNTVETKILPYIKYIANINTSYGAGYTDWFMCIDDTTRQYMWMPPSIKALGVYLNCDLTENPWSAPAGLKRGKITDAYDIAFNPTNAEAGKIYTNQWNYAFSYPYDGITLEGQKTFQINQTAFDRVNVRRLFLAMERSIRRISRTFLYEGITDQMLSRFRDLVNQYMIKVKSENGVVDYVVICDGRNNTAETIDNNEVHITVGARPVKTAEFIVMNFVCTSQSANVEEVTSQYL